jgi:Xaa-Pro dipeptidase
MRIEKLKKVMAEKGLTALAVNAGPSLTYLTGLHFHLMERPVVVIFSLDNEPTVILPELEQKKLEGLSFPVRQYTYGEDPVSWPQEFSRAVEDLHLTGQKIGIEPNQFRVLEYQLLSKACPGAGLVDGSEVVALLRSVKDAAEIQNMTEAVKIAESALVETLKRVKIGVTEKDIASELFLQLLRQGSESSLPFSPIVAAGPNGANPHSTPTSRKLQSGDLLIIDWGARYKGYASDLTRTFGVGKVEPEAKRIHELVQKANEAGRCAGAPGIACGAVDDAARNVIETGGYGAFFTHRTGHGIGMECHEDPYMRAGNTLLLIEGMTYTVEPGIYISGKNGVRIEDDVLVTVDGATSLSTMERGLVYIDD